MPIRANSIDRHLAFYVTPAHQQESTVELLSTSPPQYAPCDFCVVARGYFVFMQYSWLQQSLLAGLFPAIAWRLELQFCVRCSSCSSRHTTIAQGHIHLHICPYIYIHICMYSCMCIYIYIRIHIYPGVDKT